jgi:hypothetical protein
MGCGSACSDNFVLSTLPTWNQNSNLSHSTIAFIHLKQLRMGIWQHTHIVTTTEVSQDLGEFAEIIDDVSVEMIPLSYY